MLDIALTYITPFALTLIIAGAIRLFGGPERGARAAGVGVMIGFAIAWVIFVRPGWWPVSDFTRIGHIALGATVVGLALDLLGPKRFWAAVAAAVVLLICAASSLTGKVALPDPTLAAWGSVVVLALAAFLMLARLDALKGKGITAALLMTAALVGVAVMAAVAGDARLVTTGLILASAVCAFGVLQVAGGLPMGDSVLLGGGTTLFALAWALAHGHPETRLALLLLPLIFFAEGTANRVPLPQARISALLYPLVLAGLAALPVALAAFVVYVTAAP
jgi:hypothetical protein